MGEQAVKADRHAEADRDVHDQEDRDVAPVELTVPGLPADDREQQRGHGGDQPRDRAIQVLEHGLADLLGGPGRRRRAARGRSGALGAASVGLLPVLCHGSAMVRSYAEILTAASPPVTAAGHRNAAALPPGGDGDTPKEAFAAKRALGDPRARGRSVRAHVEDDLAGRAPLVDRLQRLARRARAGSARRRSGGSKPSSTMRFTAAPISRLSSGLPIT